MLIGHKLSIISNGNDFDALLKEFDKNHNEWMSCHNIREWVKKRKAKKESTNACSNFGFGYQTVSDFDNVPYRWLSDDDPRLQEEINE